MMMNRPRHKLLNSLTILALAYFLTACSDGSNGGAANALAKFSDFEAYIWEQLASGTRWEPRAGLRVLDMDDRFYLMGGRTPNPPMTDPPIPGDSTLWSDVWVSEDRGVSWQQVLETGGDHWAPRAYFQALQLNGLMYVIGGQDFTLVELPFCAGQPADVCPPFVPESQFFNDVWSSPDGVNWELETAAAGWAGRAGLSAAVLNGEMYIAGGSTNDDIAIIGGPPTRIYYNDVWKSGNGREWTLVTESAPWAPRAGGVMVTKGDYLYMLGGEFGFLCEPQPTCELPYFNDVWRSADGATWKQVTAAAGWSPRPGHQCGVIRDSFICFGGFGLPENPVDVWSSEDGAEWTLLENPPWDARSPEDIKYDFDIVVSNADGIAGTPAIYTFGGDRETFDFTDLLNYLRVDDDVWRFTYPEE